MDKTLKEKIIDSTFEGLDKVIENEYKHHPNENSYSLCRLQEGYNDYLKIIFRKIKGTHLSTFAIKLLNQYYFLLNHKN